MTDKYNGRDVLIGTWEGGADDGSGLRTMIYNFGLEFREDGSGVSFLWDTKHRDETPIRWEYIGEGKIRIQYVEDLETTDWNVIEYEMSDFVGAYKSAHIRLVEKGKEEFWDFPEPLYKLLYKPDPGILTWLRQIFFKKERRP